MQDWHVLVVEDDPHGQNVATTVLKFNNISVDVASTAEDGLLMLKQNRYNAAIVDLALPGMDGWSLLKHVQADPELAALPCVAVTAFHSTTVALEAIKAGFVAYFPKPISAATFVKDLRRYIPS